MSDFTPDFYSVLNDAIPTILATLRDGNGDVVPLANANTITLRALQVAGGNTSFISSCAVVDADGGQIECTCEDAFPTVDGLYDVRFKVKWLTGKPTNFPNTDQPKKWLVSPEDVPDP